MPTITLRCSEIEKTNLTEIINKVTKDYPDRVHKRIDAVKIIFEIFEGKTKPERELDPDIENVIQIVGCDYLKYNELEGYQCLEHFWKAKKPMLIGSNAHKVIERCDSCKLGKDDQTGIMINTMLLKKGVKGILDLRESLIHISKEGAIAQIYFCRADQFTKNRLILSADGENLECPLEENAFKNVKQHCYQAIDPVKMTKPCQYLLDPYVKVKLKVSESAQEIFEGMKALKAPSTKIEKKEVEATVISE